MGKGGPQPAHQVRPGDLQLEEAGLDLEDPEVFGHLMMPVGQLLCNNEASNMEGSVGELLDDADDADDDDDDDNDVHKDMVDEVINEHGNIWEGPTSAVIYNVNNSAKKSKKSTRKGLSSVLHRVDFLLQEIVYRGSKWKLTEKREPPLFNVEFMNKTYNNKYLSSIEEEEDTESKAQTKASCQRKQKQSNQADLGIPSGESHHGAVSKRRFNSCRRLLPGLWRDALCETPRSTTAFLQGNILGDGKSDYKELRKGMGDVMEDTSELNNLALISDNDKAEVNNDESEIPSPGKLSVDRSQHDEMDQTTAADFSSFLDPGSDCWNADNASQTTLVDGDPLSSSQSSPKEQEKATTQKEDTICQLRQDKDSPPEPSFAHFRDHQNTKASGVYLKVKKQLSDISEEIITEFSNKKDNANSVRQDRSSAKCPQNDLPDCQVKDTNSASSKPVLQPLPSLPQPPGAISKNSNQRRTSQKAPKSQKTSSLKNNKLEKFLNRDQSRTDLTDYNPENVTQNHSSSQSLEGSLEQLRSKVNCGQRKCSESSSIKRRNLSKVSITLPEAIEERHAREKNIDVQEVTILKRQKQEFICILKLDMEQVSEKQHDNLAGLRSMIAQDGSANDTKSTAVAFHSIAQRISVSVHDNLRPTTFSLHDNDPSNSLHNYDTVKSRTYSIYDSPQQIALSIHDKPNNFLLDNKSKPKKSRALETSKLNAISAPDNAQTNTFSILSQTSELNTGAQCPTNEPKATTENERTATPAGFGFADMDMHKTASERVLSKLLTSKQSQELRESAKSFYYKSKGIQADTATVKRNRQRSHQMPPSSAPLPPISEIISSSYNPNTAQFRGDRRNKNVREPRKTFAMHDNLNKDKYDHTNNKLPNKLPKDLYQWISVSSPASKKRHIMVDNQKRSPPLLHSARMRSAQSSKVNANLNSTSSYQSSERQDQDEVTVRISTDSQSETNSRFISASSKIPTTSTTTNPQKKNGGVLSYFGNRLFNSPNSPNLPNVPNRESSVDGERYPLKKAAISAVQETASQTLEHFWPNSLRKVECHHYHIVSDYEQGVLEEHGTQTEIINPGQETNKLAATSANVRKGYSQEMSIQSTPRKKKAVLPKIKEQELPEKHKKAKEYSIEVISPNFKDVRLPQHDSLTESKLTDTESPKLRGKSIKKATKKQRQQVKKEARSQRYAQENMKPLMSLDQQNTELIDTAAVTMGQNSINDQQLSPPNSENVQYATTYSDSFQDPEVLKSFHNILDSEPRKRDPSWSKQRSNNEDDRSRQKKLDNEASKRFVAFEHVMRNKLRNQNSSMVYGSTVDKRKRSISGSAFDKRKTSFSGSTVDKRNTSFSGSTVDKRNKSFSGSTVDKRNTSFSGSTDDKQNRSVSFSGRQVPGTMSSMPLSRKPDVSIRLQRSKSVPPSFAYTEFRGDLKDPTNDKETSQGQDRWTLNYATPDPPTTPIERAKYAEPQVMPSRLYADSYYDPANNVISVVVKPVNVNLNQRLRNIKVKIYRSPPGLPPITCVPKQRKDSGSKKTHFSAPLSRNIIDRRAANPPFNTTTNQEADERYRKIFGHRQIL